MDEREDALGGLHEAMPARWRVVRPFYYHGTYRESVE